MSSLAKDTKATMIPCLRYHDAAKAIDWLCEAFGFERQLVVPGEGGLILHAQLVFGNGMVMLGSARDDDYGVLHKPLARPGDPVSQTNYLIVSDVDAAPRHGGGRGGRDRHGSRGPGTRRPALLLPRPGGQPLVLRQLRPLGRETVGERGRPPAKQGAKERTMKKILKTMAALGLCLALSGIWAAQPARGGG